MHPVKPLVAQSRDQQIARTAQPAPVRATDMASGARAVLPAVVAFAPLALMVGAAVAASDNPMAAWLSTWSIHGFANRSVRTQSGMTSRMLPMPDPSSTIFPGIEGSTCRAMRRWKSRYASCNTGFRCHARRFCSISMLC